VNKKDLRPDQVVLDLVLTYSPTMPMLGRAAVLHGGLIIAAKNHREQFVSMSLPVHFDGEPFDGDPGAGLPPRWVLFKLGPTVWKLSPSVLDQSLHAYITIVGVPEDVSWGKP